MMHLREIMRMNPPNIETPTDARSKSRVELAPTMPCKKEEDQRSTREVPLAPELREERQAYVREKWVPPAPEHQLERKNVCTIANRWSSESRAKLALYHSFEISSIRSFTLS